MIIFLENILAEVRMPSGRIDQPRIEDNRDGTVRVQYDPREDGIHELCVKYNGEHVQGSPYKFHVDSISSGHVTAYGPGLTHGVTGEPCNFTISTKGAGAGGLSLAVEGPSKAEVNRFSLLLLKKKSIFQFFNLIFLNNIDFIQ